MTDNKEQRVGWGDPYPTSTTSYVTTTDMRKMENIELSEEAPAFLDELEVRMHEWVPQELVEVQTLRKRLDDFENEEKPNE